MRLVGPSAPATKRGLPSSARDAVGRGAGELCAFAIQLIGEVRQVVIGLRDRGRGEGVGGDDVGAGAQIIGVDILDRLRLGQDQQIVVASDIAMEVRKSRTAKRGFVILQALDHGAHGAVEHQDAFAGGGEQGGSLWGNRRSSDQAAFCAPLGRMPSRWLIANTRSARFMV